MSSNCIAAGDWSPGKKSTMVPFNVGFFALFARSDGMSGCKLAGLQGWRAASPGQSLLIGDTLQYSDFRCRDAFMVTEQCGRCQRSEFFQYMQNCWLSW